jgi:hypothetical protein
MPSSRASDEDDGESFGLREFWTSLDEKQKHALLALRRVRRGERGSDRGRTSSRT